MSFQALSLWLYDWQTLIGAMLAIAAAGVSVWYLRKQIAQVDRHEEGRLRRRLAAARATLPLTLSGVIDYVEAVANGLRDFHDELDTSGWVSGDIALDVPTSPIALVPSLERMIEATSEVRISDRLSDLVSDIQILNARLADAGARGEYSSVSKNWISAQMIQAGLVYAQAASLFGYARRTSGSVGGEIEWDNIKGSLNGLQIWEERYPGVWEMIERRQKDGDLPGK